MSKQTIGPRELHLMKMRADRIDQLAAQERKSKGAEPRGKITHVPEQKPTAAKKKRR
jgi:hypothetical protein